MSTARCFFPSRRLVMLLLFGLVAVTHSAVDAQTSLQLGTASVIPGSEDVPISLTLSNDFNVHEVDAAGVYDDSKLTLTEISLSGGVLMGLQLELLATDIDNAHGEFSVRAVLDSSAPFQTLIGAGSDQLLATLSFNVENFLFPGTTAPIQFADGIGDPPVDNLVLSNGVALSLALEDGAITITEEHVLTVSDDAAAVGEVGHLVPIRAFNTDDIQGFSIVIAFDTTVIEGADFTTEDTITTFTGSEFEHVTIDNDQGFGIFAVLLDALPPFDGQVIPSSGTELILAYFQCNVLEGLEGISQTVIALEDGYGEPPISNIFVIDAESVTPLTVPGTLMILGAGIFVRGDANQDGRLDIADPIFTANFVSGLQGEAACLSALDSNDNGEVDLADAIFTLNYLFLEGPPIPAPFPKPGLDPTPDELICVN